MSSSTFHGNSKVDLPDLTATHAFAVRTAELLQAGDVIALRGDLGVGKSEFARALIRARAGAEIEVPSPTFTIIQDYPLTGLTLRHIDLYRLADPDELLELGLEDAPAEHEAWLVEWPERAGGRLMGAVLTIEFRETAAIQARTAHVTGDASWASRMISLIS